MSLLTVILPAAGKGTKLNLPYPKEILRLDKDEALIDFSFDFFRDRGRAEVEFVVVVNEEKTEILKYLGRYKDRFNVSFTFQNPREPEYTGAIKSARHLFGESNLVLLPDTVMTLPPGVDLVDAVRECLAETGFTFLFKRETDPGMLRTKGALAIGETGQVDEYEDKPTEELGRFNAFWGGFAFLRGAFDASMGYMEKSTLKRPVLPGEVRATPLHGSRGIEVLEYKDLGTWEEIRKLLRDTV